MKQNTIHHGDARYLATNLGDNSVHCIVTSPPYFGLRDYGVDGQMGLEKTPEEYLSTMVDLFRVLYKKLRHDGTLWLNMGDFYAGSGKGEQGASGEMADRAIVNARKVRNSTLTGGLRTQIEALRSHEMSSTPNLKPKDLGGIPWRLALALQQPYYTGKIKNERDRVWLAAIIDGHGCMFIHKRKVGQSNGQGYVRKTDSFGTGLEVTSINEDILKHCATITGVGSICCVDRKKKRTSPLFRWNVRSNECKWIIEEIYPHLIAKKHQARILLNCPASGDEAAQCHQSLIDLHNCRATSLDFNAPETLFEPGYYLRQDIIWNKMNPMPESVYDRCTKSHEYIFLLAKSRKYYYDYLAISTEVRTNVAYKTPDGWDTTSGEGGHGSFHKNGREKGSIPELTRVKYAWGRAIDSDPTDNRRGDGSAIAKRKSGNLERKPRPGTPEDNPANQAGSVPWEGAKANKRSVWTVTTQPFKEAHFATFPQKLIVDCIKAGTSEYGCCAICGAPYVRDVQKELVPIEGASFNTVPDERDAGADENDQASNRVKDGHKPGHANNYCTTGWKKSCRCPGAGIMNCVVLDPFMGAGTTALVARKLNRSFIGFEINEEYIRIAEDRLRKDLGLFI